MGAHQRPIILYLRSIFFTLIIITTLLIAPTSCFSNANPVSTLKEENKVTLELYYETLCPYCSRFIANHLYKIFETGVITIIDLKLIPYGNAKVSTNNTIICQIPDKHIKISTLSIPFITKSEFQDTRMGWSQQLVKLCFLSCLIFLTSPNHVSCKKVSLELYYESLCPYSAAFIVEHLAQIFDNGIIDIAHLNLVPWGNAKLQTNTTFKCQHGEYECLLNTVEACAIDAWPDVNEHFPFIYCVENLVYEGKYLQWESCYKTLGLDDKPIADCVNSEKGLELELKYAADTNALQPPHVYVPWVVVDGEPLYDDYENFLDFVCKAYKGSAPPSVCEEPVSTIKMPKWKLNHPVCYKEVMSKLSGVRATLRSWIDQLMFLV